jgi:hypothetical protein
MAAHRVPADDHCRGYHYAMTLHDVFHCVQHYRVLSVPWREENSDFLVCKTVIKDRRESGSSLSYACRSVRQEAPVVFKAGLDGSHQFLLAGTYHLVRKEHFQVFVAKRFYNFTNAHQPVVGISDVLMHLRSKSLNILHNRYLPLYMRQGWNCE